MRMTYHNSLDHSLRWRAVGRLEAGQSQAEVARWLQVALKLSPGDGINSKQVALSPVSRMASQLTLSASHCRASASAQDRPMALSAR
ncbi:hypothetical protein TNCV_676461 [Trichonephila clavipes]|nr:hypothetical protein TNCV_676461 [Trichonephila clavipes]